MVDIEYQPIKKIIVHEIIKNTLDEYLRMKAVPPVPNQPVIGSRWIDGILFDPVGYPNIPEIIRDNMEGIVHWNIVNFTDLPEYKPILNHPDTGAPLQVIDNSTNTAVSDFIRWLKTQSQWGSSLTA